MVGRPSGRAEAFSKGNVDLLEKKILVKVRTKQCENHCRRRGKGSLTMTISQGLVNPNLPHNLSDKKGKTVNIPLLFKYVR